MNKLSLTKLFLAVVFAMINVFFCGCASTPTPRAANYFSAPAVVRLNVPVYLIIQDDRPQVERKEDPSSPYIYTVDGADPNRAAQNLGRDICGIMERKGIASRARVAFPGEIPPADGVVVRMSLLSWYGRLPKSTITENVIGALLSNQIYADGRCRFSSTLTHAGQTVELGLAEGRETFQVSRQATIAREGNTVTAAAADKAMAKFLQAFEKRFAK